MSGRTAEIRPLTDTEQALVSSVEEKVRQYIRRCYGQGKNTDVLADCEQAGLFRVCCRIRDYDPTRGASIETFACGIGRGAAMQWLRDRADFFPHRGKMRDWMIQFFSSSDKSLAWSHEDSYDL